MSNDVVTYTADRFIVIDNKIAELNEIYSDEGETKNDFTTTFYSLVRDKGRFMDAVSRQVGGVYVTRLVNGQDSVNAYEPVPYKKQKAAMNLIINKFLANGVWTFDPAILKNLQREKRATVIPVWAKILNCMKWYRDAGTCFSSSFTCVRLDW